MNFVSFIKGDMPFMASDVDAKFSKWWISKCKIDKFYSIN